MFNEKYIMDKIVRELNLIKFNINSFSKLNIYDLNIYSENFFCKLLNIVFDLDLINLNIVDMNMPAIDLGDIEKKICYQITSTNDSSKINNTIEKFEKYELYENYEKLYILILSDKKDYNSNFKSNGKYTFENKNILDINDLIKIISSKDEEKKSRVYELINQSIIKVLSSNPNQLENKPDIDINNILLDKKEIAINKYDLSPEKINCLILKLNGHNFNNLIDRNYYISEDNIKTIYNCSLFFQSFDDNDFSNLSRYIKIYPTQIKYAIGMFVFFYERPYSRGINEIDSYLYENILRILNNLIIILESEINISYSSGSGNFEENLLNNSLIVSISKNDNNDNKIIFLEKNKDKNIGHKFSLGGISEKVMNIKKFKFFNENYIMANSGKNIYLWNINKSNSNPLLINEDKYLISDYEHYEINNSLFVVVVTNCNTIIVWKIIDHIIITHSIIKLETSGYIFFNVNGKNKVINNDVYSKQIYKYDIDKKIIEKYFEIPSSYFNINNMAIHPIKNQIAFSYSIPDTEDIDERKITTFEFENVAVYDIDNKAEIFKATEKNHFIIKLSYIEKEGEVYLIIYDRDGAGNDYQPLVKVWKQTRENRFLVDYVYDSYPKEKNFILYCMMFNDNNVYFYTFEEKLIVKVTNLKENTFYKLSEDYYVNDIL